LYSVFYVLLIFIIQLSLEIFASLRWYNSIKTVVINIHIIYLISHCEFNYLSNNIFKIWHCVTYIYLNMLIIYTNFNTLFCERSVPSGDQFSFETVRRYTHQRSRDRCSGRRAKRICVGTSYVAALGYCAYARAWCDHMLDCILNHLYTSII